MITKTISISPNDLRNKERFVQYCLDNNLSFTRTANTKDGEIYDVVLPSLEAQEKLNAFLN